jgi:HD-GYP domain-containing protein (c-di-GMP phosphodiesterase class II)
MPPDELYARLIVSAHTIISAAGRGEAFKAPVSLISTAIDCIDRCPDDLLLLVDRATPDIYLYGHSTNVCILAMLLERTRGKQRDELVHVGLAALLHDLGMARYVSVVQRAAKLTSAELQQVKRHPLEGSRLIALESSLSEAEKDRIAGIILQVHERRNGSGYPVGLKGDEICENARTIALVDAYESLSHPRSYRERHIPHDAIKTLIGATDEEFEAADMKMFVDRISLYPPGSYVRLNTDEIARVIGINPGLPTRPRVRVVVTPDFHRPAEQRLIDLAVTPTIFVKDAVDELKLPLADKKLALELKAIRWWVKGL